MKQIRFDREEFACECNCGFDAMDYILITKLERSREYFIEKYGKDVVIVVTGGNRCREHNETVQKMYNPLYVPYSSNSMHIRGIAADVKHYTVDSNGSKTQIDPKEVYEYFDKDPYIGLGLYSNRVHVDARGHKARWGNS